MINSILISMVGIEPSPHDPCLFSGIIKTSSKDLSRHCVHVGMYVDDFVFHSTDPAEEALLKSELQQKVKVDFMGDTNFFLGTAFTWLRHELGDCLSVHLCQSAFTEHSSHCFGVYCMNPIPNMTPYCSGDPIDSIHGPDKDDPDLKQCTKIYQGIIGSINWFAQCSRPDIAPCLTFLVSYQNAPHHQHYLSALHVIKYLYSTSEYGISFHSSASSSLQAFNHFPNHHDKDAYSDATPPAP